MNNKKFLGLYLTVFGVISLIFALALGISFAKIANLHKIIAGYTSPTISSEATSSLEKTIVSTVASVNRSVVSISVNKDIKVYAQDPSQMQGPGNIQQQTAKIGGGSGIVVSKDGYIITNKHVVQDTSAAYIVTLFDGTTYPVDKVWFDDDLDIAIIKIVSPTEKNILPLVPATFLPISTTVSIGQFALTMGNSLGIYPNTVSLGLIGGKNKSLTLHQTNRYVGLYQTDAVVNPGNSGGPLFDVQGNVLGIVTAITEGQGVAFALPISKEFVSSTLASLEKFGKIVRPIIGIQYTENTLSTGIVITDVLADLPGFQAGIQVGDIVTHINNQAITHQLPFLYQLYTALPGDTLTLSLIRNHESLTLPVVLGGDN